MIELLWGFFNLLIFCFILIKSYHLIHFTYKKIGRVYGFLATLLIVSIMFKKDNYNHSPTQFALNNLNITSLNSTTASSNGAKKVIEDNFINTITLYANYNVNQKKQVAFTTESLAISGLQCATEIQPISAQIHKTAATLYEYELLCIKNWNFVGRIRIYSHTKKFTGFINVKLPSQ